MMDHFHIIFAPLLPYPWLAALASAALLLALFALYRRARGAVFRTLLFTLLLLVLANPSLIAETREPLKDKALVVVDDSASMKLGGRGKQVADALEKITQKLDAFPDLEFEVLHVAGEDETDLFRAIEQKRGTIPTDRFAGTIALTDGEIHDAPISDFPAPFHALIVGRKNEIDRRLIIKSAPAYGIVGKKAVLTLRVEDAPKPQSDKAVVTINRDDGSIQTITVPVGEDVKVETNITHGGANLLGFETETLPGEITPLNNVAVATINGIRDRLRVLMVAGQPHIGGRQWLNLLKGDAGVDLVNFTILRSPFKDNAVPNNELSLIAFPSHEVFDTKLNKFDLVIFDGFSSRLLVPDSYLNNIAAYVEHGGALLLSDATGAQATELGHSPLARVLPTTSNGEVVTGRFVPALSEAGKRHPVTSKLGDVQAQNLWSPWYRQVDAHVSNDTGEVLMTGINQKPLLVLAHVGKGRVAQFLSNQFWLWARDYPEGGPEGEMLRRTAHWLMKEPELDETALHAKAEHIENNWQLSISKQSLKNDTANVVVTGPNNQPLQVKLMASPKDTQLHATVPAPTPGLYHVKDDAHDIMVMAGIEATPEFGAMVATEDILEPAAKASDGSVTWLADNPDGPEIRRTGKGSSQHGYGWIGLKQNGQYRVTGSNATPLWPAWAALALLLAAAMWMWRREGR